MSSEAAPINAVVIRRTQDLLGKYVKKPVLSEKLLRKPPFRFLHDVISAVIQQTGYLDDVYTPEELIYENINGKDAKIEFLQKLIDAVKTNSADAGKLGKVRPSKIVAGQEAERTNELLQAIGRALEGKLSGASAKRKAGTETSSNAQPNSNKASSSSLISGGSKTDPSKSRTTTKMSKPSSKASSKGEDTKQPKTKSKTSSSSIVQKPLKNSSKSKQGTGDANNATIEKSVASETAASANELLDNATAKDDQTERQSMSGMSEQFPSPNAPSNQSPALNEVTNNNVIAPADTGDDDEDAEFRRNEKLAMQMDLEPEPIAPPPPSAMQRRKSSGNMVLADEQLQQLQLDADEPNDNHTTDDDALDKRSSHRRSDGTTRKSRRSSRRTAETGGDGGESSDVVAPMGEMPKTSKIPTAVAPMAPSKHEDQSAVQRPRTSLRPPSGRPASARPGAPRRRERYVEVILQQPSEGNSAADATKSLTAALDMNLLDDGDLDNMIVVEDPMPADAADLPAADDSGQPIDASAEAGHLVQQILRTQTELNAKADADATEPSSVQQQQRQSSAKQMDSLRDSIQQLTRNVNPLGKLMDFLQEDIDAMQMELTQWRESYATARTQLVVVQNENESAVVPLRQQLLQIENNIREHIALTQASRYSILQNEEKIVRLLSEF